MPSAIRAIGHQIPLRSPKRLPSGANVAPNLLDHHQYHHPNEPYLQPEYHPQGDITVGGYTFYGRFIKAGQCNNNDCASAFSLPKMRLSEVAALALEQTFGKAESLDHLFVLDGAMNEELDPGRVFLNQSRDQITAYSALDQISLLLKAQSKEHNPRGGNSNVIEAGGYFPIALELIRGLLQAGRIPIGVESIEITIVDQLPQQAEQPQNYAHAASPLKIHLSLPNLDNATAADIRINVANALEQALGHVSDAATGQVIPFPHR